MLAPADDLRHALRAEPHARESLFYGAMLPDEQLMLFLYTWVGHDNRAGHMVAVVGGDDERHVFSASDGEDVGDADFGDWTVGPMHVSHSELLKTADLTFATEAAQLSVRFAGLHDAFSYRENEDGCPSFVADDRFEQSCRVTGTLTLAGREITIDTTGHRDHSWGTRDWDTIQDWKWISAQTAAGDAIHLMLLHGRGETTRHGYVLRGGVLHRLIEARVRAAYDERWWQTGAEISILDESGATTTVSATRFALLRFEAGERMVLHEAGCTGTIDGVPAVVHFEAGWDRSYVALQAARVAAAAT